MKISLTRKLKQIADQAFVAVVASPELKKAIKYKNEVAKNDE